MRSRIEAQLPKEKHSIQDINFEKIHVVDWKKTDTSRGVEATEECPDISHVCIHNTGNLLITFDGFEENALPIKKGLYCKQCECVLFPTKSKKHWVLFIETKYADDWKLAFRKDSNYPRCMVEQVVETVKYFRKKGVLEEKQSIHAIVAFPNLIEDNYGEYFFNQLAEVEPNYSIEKIQLNHNITLRACNAATVISEKEIKLSSPY